jgi:two-component system, chemotaxis family, sensor kinase CheA
MNIDEALPTFIAEAAELLREMELGLLACADHRESPSSESVNSLFRCAHTIKGSSGLFGLDAIVGFVHNVEAVLDRVRLGEIALDEQLITVLLKCKDHIEALVARAAEGQPVPEPALTARGDELLDMLRVVTGSSTDQADQADHAEQSDQATRPVEHVPTATGTWHICLRFGTDVLTSGMDPMAFLRYLNTFGSIRGLVVIDDDLPPIEELDPEKCYLGFEIAFSTSAPRERIEGAFDFVREDCALRMVPPQSPPIAYFETLRTAGLDDARIAGILQQCGSLTAADIEQVLHPAESAPGGGGSTPRAAASTLSVDTGTTQMAEPAPRGTFISEQSAPRATPQHTQGASRDSRTIRVDANKLDQLITHIGELITAAATANLVARRSGNSELEELTSNVAALIEQVREGSLQLRMVKIGATFNRFQRVVHDVSRELGKEIELIVSGEDTELDKTVVERITDPLTHLVRNAIDHGIEPADSRTACGKAPGGTIKLNAFHESGTIVIEVSDDGGGLKRERILAKAVERGLIAPGQVLSDTDVLNLVFEPGFSTAEKVTNLSGRGVGMDVVKRNIIALRGDVSIKSIEGAGTTVTVRLPLTLAIINGFQVAVGKSIFVLPLETIEECVDFSAEPGHDFTSLRGEVLPFVQLHTLFGTSPAVTRRQSIVVVRHAGHRAGIVVDALLGEFQTVIKPLGKIFKQVECVSGSSILGTGDVALILDVPALVARAIQRARTSSGHEAKNTLQATA